MAAANPNTVVVLNTTNPVLMPWIGNVKSVLEMWFSGEEGGTSTARLLLGLANPSGHTDITWPANATDTIWGYNETVPLYPGDTTGPHLERLNGGAERHHRRDGGHLQRLPVLRQGGHHAAVPVRLRPVLHQLRLLRPARAAGPPTAG